jgi:hypothetical protein
MSRCLFIRARLTGVDKDGSRWKVTERIKGEVAPNTILIAHDEFRRRAETVVRDQYRESGVSLPDVPEFREEVDEVAAKMIETELPATAIGAEAILAVDGFVVTEAGKQYRLRKLAFEDASGKHLDALEAAIRDWKKPDHRELSGVKEMKEMTK